MSGQTTGRFLALEGIDGSGKSTQLQLLLERLRARGVECRGTREPSDGPVGAMVRQILTGRVTADHRVIAGLFAADRLDHLVNRRDGILEQQPTLVNLQCDVDHPTQCMADMLHIIHQFGGVENLKGKKIAMTWAYSPSYGKPLSVPQGVIGLMTRFGMDVVLAHPEGYDVMPEVEEIARKNAQATGGSYKKVSTMEEAFDGADIVYPKSWAPFAAMEERTKLYQAGDQAGIDQLEKKLLAQNAQHKNWSCTEEMMKRTRDGKALYLHCLPADITGLSCPEGEVDNSVFDRYLVPLYKEASYKPYVIAAMIMMSKVKDPAAALMAMDASGKRKSF